MDAYYPENGGLIPRLNTTKVPASRKNRRRTVLDPPSATSLRDNLRKLIDADWDIMKLVPNWDNCTEGGVRIDPEVRLVVRQIATKYATEKKATYAGLWLKVKVRLDELNDEGRGPYSLPCKQTITRIVKEIPEVERLIGRKGVNIARQELALVGEGPQYHRVGEHLFMDCWKMQAMSLYKENGLWDLLEPDAKEIVKPLRVWVALLRDTCSGCTLGLAISRTEKSDAMRSALRMGFMDRTAIARWADAECDWLFPLGADCIDTDGGAAFRSPEYWLAAATLIPHVRKAAGDHPRLRGGGERHFGTIDRGYLPDFTGRTGANLDERGEYDAEARASMAVDEIARGLIRWTVDVHHLTKPKAPLAQQPRRKFLRLYNDEGAKPPPTKDQLRMAFGIEMYRELGRWGVRHANVMYYRSPRLESFLQDKGPQTVRIKVDPLDIGQISVLLDKKWITVGGPPELDGVGLHEWMAYNRELERRYLAEEAIDWPTVARAIRAIEAMSDQAVAEAQIRDLQITASKMRRLVESLKLIIVYDDDPKSHKSTSSVSGGTLGKQVLPQGQIHQAAPIAPAVSLDVAPKRGRWGLRQSDR